MLKDSTHMKSTHPLNTVIFRITVTFRSIDPSSHYQVFFIILTFFFFNEEAFN